MKTFASIIQARSLPMKTLAIIVATAMFALTAPVEASAPAPADATAAAECPPGFQLRNVFSFYPHTPIVIGPGDVNGDGLYCALILGDIAIHIDNTKP
jgi:NAD(P)H-hydrate repair Nnr-like enzyme with NAD(P)H-hydrate epimerase domain